MGQQPAFAAGYGESVLTPPLGVELCGYGYYLERRAESVLDELKARAVCIRSAEHSVLLICCDLIGLTVAHTDAIRASISRQLEIPAGHILIACTHTHTGPATVPLRGVGEMDPAYVATVAGALERAAAAAAADVRSATLTCAFPYVEPIGYNRRLRSYEPIDPVLKVALIERATGSIALTSYACHAVTLGRANCVSADWPGGAVRAFERRGYRAVAFQGFCGDIDPVLFLNGWGSGTAADLDFAGELLCQRALKAVAATPREETPELAVAEERVDLPLDVPADRAGLDRELAAYLATGPSAGAERMIRDWHREAQARYDALRAAPRLAGVPIQGLALGTLRLLGVPGEVFSEYSTALRASRPTLFTVGYAGGCVDYIPTDEAYDHAGDYAAYAAPRFYHLFPFQRTVQQVVMTACERVLARVR
ncbi:MAG: hypothetical protein GX557_07090 [Chloroflexi bacterium]|nr:hypothetical protein [Chloroflexota bacterium]